MRIFSLLPVAGTLALLHLAGCSGPPRPENDPGAAASPAPAEAASNVAVKEVSRNFHFEYSVKIPVSDPAAQSVRVWVPLPTSDENQTISNLKIHSPLAARETTEPLYENKLAYFELNGPVKEALPIRVELDVVRKETGAWKGPASSVLATRLLQGDRLAPTSGEAEARAVAATAGRSAVAEKARGIYDRVLADVAYDKTGTGWGKGDLAYVCAAGKGNCSDFHALFISMARSQKIPALFEIGFPLPRDKKEGTVGGYHCWAWFQDTAGSWRPVDASEADKDPPRTDYYFGTICANRVAFTRGRDLVLEPPQAGGPVNFLIYPYVEIDGNPLDPAALEKAFSFRDLN